MRIWLLIVGWFAIILNGAFAAIVTWDSGAGTANWEDANNWSPDGVPGVADQVRITSGNSANYQSSSTITQLRLGAAFGTSWGGLTLLSGNLVVSDNSAYYDCSGTIVVAGGNLTITNVGTATYNCQFGKRAGSTDNLMINNGFFVANSRFGTQGGSSGTFHFQVSGNGMSYIYGHSTSWVPGANIYHTMTIKDNGVFDVGNISTNIGGAGTVTVAMSGNRMNFIGLVTLGSSSGNTYFYHSAGNVELANTLKLGDDASDGPTLYELMGAGNLRIGSYLSLYSGNSIFRINGANCMANVIDRLDCPVSSTPTLSFVPSIAGVSTLAVKDLYLNGRAALDVNVSAYTGAKTLNLIRYSGIRNTATGGGNFSSCNISGYKLGSNPSGDPNNLDKGEYYLDYGSGNNDSVKLYYNTPIGNAFFIE